MAESHSVRWIWTDLNWGGELPSDPWQLSQVWYPLHEHTDLPAQQSQAGLGNQG